MNNPGAPVNQLFSRDRLQVGGVALLLLLLLLGLILFVVQVLVPDVRDNRVAAQELTLLRGDLALAQRDRELAPARAQSRLDASATRLAVVASPFLDESEAAALVRRIYAYAQASGVDVVNQQAPATVSTEPAGRQEVRFQIAGSLEGLLAFLGRIQESSLPGFLFYNVNLSPDGLRHLLSLDAAVFTSPYAQRTLDADFTAGLAELSTAELQRRLEVAWLNHDWDSVIRLLQQAMTVDESNQAVRGALYRAHVNYGYQLVANRAPDAARRQFETALMVQPGGREALVELEQLDADVGLAHRVEDTLRQALRDAEGAEEWLEVIRLLRVIALVDPDYGPVETELVQAYIRYGNAMMALGDVTTAEEYYRLARSLQPNEPWPPAGLQLAPTPTPTPLPTATPTATDTPTVTPTATESPTPTPSSSPTPTATPTETTSPTPTPTPSPFWTPTPLPIVPPIGIMPTPIPNPTDFPPAPYPTLIPYPTYGPIVPLPPQPGPTFHVVQPGDTLFSLARRFGTTVQAIRAANGLSGDLIRVGQTLIIGGGSPPPSGALVHIVTYNDTLSNLARRYGVTIEAIQRANGLVTTQIYVGQQLRIPR